MNEIEWAQTVAGQELDEEYGKYIMEHGERPICNGDALIAAMEESYLWAEFMRSIS